MAKARPNKTEPDDTKKPQRSGVALNTYIDEDLRQCLADYIADHNTKDEHHATVRSAVEAALKMYLKSKGFFPPKPTT